MKRGLGTKLQYNARSVDGTGHILKVVPGHSLLYSFADYGCISHFFPPINKNEATRLPGSTQQTTPFNAEFKFHPKFFVSFRPKLHSKFVCGKDMFALYLLIAVATSMNFCQVS